MERLVERLFEHVFCSLRSHGTRDKGGSIIDRCYRERLAWCAYSAMISARDTFA